MRINLILPDDLLKDLDSIAERNYQTRTEIVKNLINEFVKKENKPLKKYYIDNPRGFRNEFVIISVNQNDPREVALMNTYLNKYENSSNINWSLNEISDERAAYIINDNKNLREEYISAGLNLHQNPVGATEIVTATDYFYHTITELETP